MTMPQHGKWPGKAKMRTQVPQDLWTTKKLLGRVDKIQLSLGPMYTGPCRVMRRWDKCRFSPFYKDTDPIVIQATMRPGRTLVT